MSIEGPQHTEHINAEEQHLRGLREMLNEKKRANLDEADDKIVTFVDKLLEIYSRDELNTYRLYHLLIRSTPNEEEKIAALDLPGGDIENFIRHEL